MNRRRFLSNARLPWLLVLLLLAALLLLMRIGWWRAAGVGPQVQVPMFYDAHYLFPRPWTQEQAAPGVPEAAPLAFYGPNRVSQPFLAGSANLGLLAISLEGRQGEVVELSLTTADGSSWRGRAVLTGEEGEPIYRFSFPDGLTAKEQRYVLTLAAPGASSEQPVVTRTVGGDRLSGALQINGYDRPGNLAVTTYARGWPGRWWLEAIAEQVLPAVFRLRLQQYKPDLFKGPVFGVLLALTGGLSLLYLILARPQSSTTGASFSRALGGSAVVVMGLLLGWQLATGRLLLQPAATQLARASNPLSPAPPAGDAPFTVLDMSSGLWSARREPEARQVNTEMVDGLSAIRVPADSLLSYALTVPPGSLLRAGVAAEGRGQLVVGVRLGDEVIYQKTLVAQPQVQRDGIVWLEIDLSSWAGQSAPLILETSGNMDGSAGLWLMPQVVTAAPWLYPDPPPDGLNSHAGGYVFDDVLELAGYEFEPQVARAGEKVTIALWWRLLRETETHGTVFVHLLDEQGGIVAQHDSQPVGGAYPLPAWQPQTLVRDEHVLSLPEGLPPGQYRLAVGVYDAGTLKRWSVTGRTGELVADGRALLDVPLEVVP